jgi:hypothetical protein
MLEPIISCPHCQKEIKLTESLAAPLVEATRRDFDRKLTAKDNEIAGREAAVREQQNSAYLRLFAVKKPEARRFYESEALKLVGLCVNWSARIGSP